MIERDVNSNKASRVDKTDYNKAAVISPSAILDVLFDVRSGRSGH